LKDVPSAARAGSPISIAKGGNAAKAPSSRVNPKELGRIRIVLLSIPIFAD
jgi:hypothetical protein